MESAEKTLTARTNFSALSSTLLIPYVIFAWVTNIAEHCPTLPEHYHNIAGTLP